MFQNIIRVYPRFSNMSKEEKLRLILNLQLKNEYAIGIICTFVKQISKI